MDVQQNFCNYLYNEQERVIRPDTEEMVKNISSKTSEINGMRCRYSAKGLESVVLTINVEGGRK